MPLSGSGFWEPLDTYRALTLVRPSNVVGVGAQQVSATAFGGAPSFSGRKTSNFCHAASSLFFAALN